MSLFKSFDFSKWAPRAVDLRHLKTLLVTSQGAHEHTLGAFVLECTFVLGFFCSLFFYVSFKSQMFRFTRT